MYKMLACGVPVIVSEMNGQSDVVAAHDCGWIIPKDDPGALATALEAVEDPRLTRLRGSNGRQAVNRQHSWDARAAEIDGILRTCTFVQMSSDTRDPSRSHDSWFGSSLLIGLVLLHAYLADRLYVTAVTDGRGLAGVTAFVLPVATVLYAFSQRERLTTLLGRPMFWGTCGLYVLAAIVGPVLGLLVFDYPVRTLFSATEGLLALSAALIGYFGRRNSGRMFNAVGSLLLVFTAIQLLMALSIAS